MPDRPKVRDQNEGHGGLLLVGGEGSGSFTVQVNQGQLTPKDDHLFKRTR